MDEITAIFQGAGVVSFVHRIRSEWVNSDSIIVVSREGQCGNGICEVGETNCAIDCEESLECPGTISGVACNGRGKCIAIDGTCECFELYSGVGCEVCAEGFQVSPNDPDTCSRKFSGSTKSNENNSAIASYLELIVGGVGGSIILCGICVVLGGLSKGGEKKSRKRAQAEMNRARATKNKRRKRNENREEDYGWNAGRRMSYVASPTMQPMQPMQSMQPMQPMYPQNAPMGFVQTGYTAQMFGVTAAVPDTAPAVPTPQFANFVPEPPITQTSIHSTPYPPMPTPVSTYSTMAPMATPAPVPVPIPEPELSIPEPEIQYPQAGQFKAMGRPTAPRDMYAKPTQPAKGRTGVGLKWQG